MMRVVLVALCCDVWRTAALVFPHTAPTTLRAHRALGPIRARHTDRLVLAAGGGHAHTVESKLKISAANKGKQPWNKGKAHSQQTRDLIGERTRAAMMERRRREAVALGMTLEELEFARAANKTAKESRTRPRNSSLSDETKAKISAALKAKWSNATERDRLVALRQNAAKTRYNRTHTEETRRKISERVKASWQTPESIQRRKDATVKTPSNETRARISESLRQRWRDPEFRLKMTGVNNATARSPAHSQKISDAIRQKWADDDGYRERAVSGIRRALGARVNATGATPNKPAIVAAAKAKAAAADRPPVPPIVRPPAKKPAPKPVALRAVVDRVKPASEFGLGGLKPQTSPRPSPRPSPPQPQTSRLSADRPSSPQPRVLSLEEETEAERRSRLRHTAPDLWAALYEDDEDGLLELH